MRYGLMCDLGRPFDDVVGQIRSVRDDGFDAAVVPQVFGYDALTLLGVAGREVPGIELMTAVVPTYPRHPLMLASQALTVQAATGGSLTLGIGLSHQVVIEGMFGYSFERPARHMREYLEVLLPLLRGEAVTFRGETLSAAAMAPLDVAAPAPPVLLAALAPAMLRLAGGVAGGTITWMAGPATVEGHIAPGIAKAAADAGRPAPRVAVGLPFCVTADPAAARERAARTFAAYGQLPSYRAMLDKEGAAGPADVAVVGTEDEVRAGIDRLAEAGATDLVAATFGSSDERARTRELLAAVAQGRA